jgi:CRISPR type III-A-associated RAMP protein Csm4
MKNYRIILKSSGAITQLPDSQKIFGALVSLFAEAHGNDKAAELVKAVINKKMHLALSNVLPLNYFPMPLDYIVDLLAVEFLDSSDLKKQREEVKKRAYIRLEDLKNVLRHPEKVVNIDTYIKQNDGQQLRASIESAAYGIQGLETRLYTVPFLKLMEIKNINGREVDDPVSEFCFYLQMDETEFGKDILEMLNEFIQTKISLILGKRASQGLNKYRVTTIESVELSKEEAYLNLGMLLPNQIDYKLSTLKLFTSERRPFSMPGGWNQKCSKYFISFIADGSVILLKNGVEQAGKCVPSPFNRSRDIVFGNAFLYPISLRKGE